MERGKGVPKEGEVNRRREVCKWDECVCVRKMYRSAIIEFDKTGLFGKDFCLL